MDHQLYWATWQHWAALHYFTKLQMRWMGKLPSSIWKLISGLISSQLKHKCHWWPKWFVIKEAKDCCYQASVNILQTFQLSKYSTNIYANLSTISIIMKSCDMYFLCGTYNCSEWQDQWYLFTKTYVQTSKVFKSFKTVCHYSEEKQGQRIFEVSSQVDDLIAELQ